MSEHGSTPLELRPCDAISEDIHLLADGELGPAERAIVEEHLLDCARCQVVAARLERMSSLLKAWDSETNDPVAPALRLRNAVLSRVTEQSAVRRREGRMIGLRHYATAALVLLVLGAGVVLGLAQIETSGTQRAAAATASATTSTGAERPWPLDVRRAEGFTFAALAPSPILTDVHLADGLDLPAVAPLQTPDVKWDAPALDAPELDAPELDARVPAGDSALGSLALLDARIQRAAAVARRLGGPVMYWAGPYADERPTHLLTQSAHRYLHESGLLEAWSRFETTSSTTSQDESVAAQRTSTGRTARQLLSPMPGVDRKLTDLFQHGRLTYVPGQIAASQPAGRVKGGTAAPRARLEVWPLVREKGLRSTPLSSKGPASPAHRFLDPVAAEANGMLHLDDSESGADTVIAIVEGTTQPIFIPAGQFITGGFADRVVAQPIWLPASKGKTPHVIPCRIVQSFLDEKGSPKLSRYLAGPTVRALLASGASQEVVKEAARRIVALRSPDAADSWDAWSLLDVFQNKGAARNYDAYRRAISWKDRRGFVVSDAQGRLVGFECVEFEGEAGQELLMRLWMSYVAEAVLRDRTGAAQALAPASDGLSQAFLRLVSSDAEFRMPAGFDPSQGWTVSSLEIYATGLHLQAFELAGRPAVISALSGLSPR